MTEDVSQEYIPIKQWLKDKKFDESILDFKTSIENDLEQLSHLIGADLVIMSAISKPKISF